MAVPPELMPHFQAASDRTGIPVPVLVAQAKQESDFGRASPNVMQVTDATAANPGFGMTGVDPKSLAAPGANINFGADYLAARAKAGGVTDWNNPDQRNAALTAYNGGGDPDYAAHVARYIPQPGASVAPSVTPAAPGAIQVAGPGAPTGTTGAPQQVTQAPTQGQPQQATGGNNPYIQHYLETIHRAQSAMMGNPYNPQIQKMGQMAIENAQTMMHMDSYTQNPDGTQRSNTTGKVENAATPNAHYIPTATGAVDTTGTHAPTYMPSPRISTLPDGATVAVGPGGIPQVVAPADNAGVGARAAANAQGTETGKTVATSIPKMVDIGREADTAIGNIDYGMNQLHQAAAGGINSGYFAPWLATAAAAGKSLGIDTKTLGVDPTAVGNVQSAQKTLGVVAGAILQNAIGKDSAITDAKIEHFIHTQPGIETDPQAIERVLGWARSQFSYNRGMAMDAMHNVDKAGNLPLNWQADYYKRTGAFAPIYDPLSQEMKQPAGQAPAAAMPQAPPEQAAPAAPQYREGQTATGPSGAKMIFTGGHWVAK